MTGQDLITTSIISLENFLSNNVPFEDNDDIINFIISVKNEDYKFDILSYIDNPIGKEELIDYLQNHMKDSTLFDREVITGFIDPLTVEDINRLYYKNQISELIKNSWFIEKLKTMSLMKYENEPETALVPILDDFKEKVIKFSFFEKLYDDRYKRAMKDLRRSIITIDTDLKLWVQIN